MRLLTAVFLLAFAGWYSALRYTGYYLPSPFEEARGDFALGILLFAIAILGMRQQRMPWWLLGGTAFTLILCDLLWRSDFLYDPDNRKLAIVVFEQAMPFFTLSGLALFADAWRRAER